MWLVSSPQYKKIEMCAIRYSLDPIYHVYNALITDYLYYIPRLYYFCAIACSGDCGYAVFARNNRAMTHHPAHISDDSLDHRKHGTPTGCCGSAYQYLSRLHLTNSTHVN